MNNNLSLPKTTAVAKPANGIIQNLNNNNPTNNNSNNNNSNNNNPNNNNHNNNNSNNNNPTQKGLVKKTSQRNKKEKPTNKPKSKTASTTNSSSTNEIPKLKFNMKKNVVDKFYSAQLASSSALSKITKTGPIDLGSIPDLPEIPLEHLIGAQ